MKLKNILLTALCLLLMFPLSTCGGPSVDAQEVLPSPVMSSAVNRNGGVLVKWEAVEDARQYRVLRRIGNGSWIRVGDTDELSLTDTDVENSGTYAYTVCCVTRDGRRLMSGYDGNGQSITYYAVPKLLSAQASSAGITVTWDAVDGISQYRIYRKASDAKNWTPLDDVGDTTFTDATAQSGATYRYTVRGLDSDGKTAVTYYNTSGIKATMK